MRSLLFILAGIACLFAVTLCSTGCAAHKAPPPVNPVTHPLAHAAAVTQKAETPLLLTAGLAGVIALGSIGLMFTSFSAISKISLPVSACVCLGSYAGVLALPIFPWVLGGAGVVFLVIAGYELWRKYKASATPTKPTAVQLVHS